MNYYEFIKKWMDFMMILVNNIQYREHRASSSLIKHERARFNGFLND